MSETASPINQQELIVDVSLLENIIKDKSVLLKHLTICTSVDQIDAISQFV